MDDKVNAQMERLLRKYASGHIPPLVDMDDPAAGLINLELVQIYQRGFLTVHSVRLGFLLAARHARSRKDKWFNGDYRLNELAKPDWASFCAALRERAAGQKACELCDQRRAVLADKKGRAIAYLCDSGMIDFATPVSVMGQVIAVLFSGQYRPQAGSIWNPELAWPNGCFRPLVPGETGVDAWAVSQWRIEKAEAQAGFEEGALLQFLSEDVKTNPVTEISPQGVEEVMKLLRVAGEQLSDLAVSTFELEKSKLVGWIRGHIARSLETLSGERVATSEAWNLLSKGLDYVVQYFAVDYVLILSCSKANNAIRLLCQAGLPGAEQWIKELASNKEALLEIRSAVCEYEQATELQLRQYSRLPLFRQLKRKHSKKSKVTQVIPLVAPEAAPSFMIVGRFDRDLDFEECLAIDREAWFSVVQDIALVTGIILLVEQMRERARQQARFMEDVAHDIRDPIQNIIVQAGILGRRLVSAEQVANLARRLAAHARRLHMMSERIWTMTSLEQGQFALDKVEQMSVYQLVMECRKSLTDLAAQRHIEITVDPEMERLRPVVVNRGLLTQTVLNLIDNAIKYSTPETEIRIDGKHLVDGVSVSFVNRGIPIHEADRERIFKRYYRTKEARKLVPAGTGIGLYIAKVFADHFGDIEFKSEPRHLGATEYITEFKLLIRHRR